jgi:ferredoxin
MAGLYSGDTGCRYGCLGQGDCAVACPFDAIEMNPRTGLPVVNEERCTACGNCVAACPKGVIELRNKGPKSRRLFVSCINQDKGGVARKACSAACIGCMKCVKVCPFEAVKVENNVAYIDFNKCRLCRKCAEACPTGAIVEVNFPIRLPKEVEVEKQA